MSESPRTIDWKSLGYPQVPELLEKLVANDVQVQRDAFHRLETEVVLGGVNWQDYDIGGHMSEVLRNDAQILLVPFLLRLLEPDSRSFKRDILALLSQMLFYSNMTEDEDDVYRERAKKIRDAIWEGRMLCLELLSHNSLRVRLASLSVLNAFTQASRKLEVGILIAQRFEPMLPPDADTSIIA